MSGMGRRACSIGAMALLAGWPVHGRPLRKRPQSPSGPEHLEQTRTELVVDLTGKRVIHALDVDVMIRPASLCKLMTLHMLFEALEGGVLSETTPVVFSANAAARPPSRLGLEIGQAIPAGEAAYAMAVHSCNDVATAVAETLAGSEPAFVERMNGQAGTMGLSATRFANASGLPDGDNRSTARDLLLLGVQVVLRHPRYAHVLGMDSWTWNGKVYLNTNRLQSAYPGIVASKTGYIRESGFNLFSMARRDGRMLAVLVTGCPTAAYRDARVAALLDGGFAA